MKSLIEELYNGNVAPFFEQSIKSAEYTKALKAVCEAEEKLLNKFPECKELFNNYQDAQSELTGETLYQRFLLGFKVGAQLMDEMKKPL